MVARHAENGKAFGVEERLQETHVALRIRNAPRAAAAEREMLCQPIERPQKPTAFAPLRSLRLKTQNAMNHPAIAAFPKTTATPDSLPSSMRFSAERLSRLPARWTSSTTE